MNQVIKDVQSELQNDYFHVYFKVDVFSGLLMYVLFYKNGEGGLGWQMSGADGHLVDQTKADAADKWLDDNREALFHYFEKECPETKLAHLFL